MGFLVSRGRMHGNLMCGGFEFCLRLVVDGIKGLLSE